MLLDTSLVSKTLPFSFMEAWSSHPKPSTISPSSWGAKRQESMSLDSKRLSPIASASKKLEDSGLKKDWKLQRWASKNLRLPKCMWGFNHQTKRTSALLPNWIIVQSEIGNDSLSSRGIRLWENGNRSQSFSIVILVVIPVLIARLYALPNRFFKMFWKEFEILIIAWPSTCCTCHGLKNNDWNYESLQESASESVRRTMAALWSVSCCWGVCGFSRRWAASIWMIVFIEYFTALTPLAPLDSYRVFSPEGWE